MAATHRKWKEGMKNMGIYEKIENNICPHCGGILIRTELWVKECAEQKCLVEYTFVPSGILNRRSYQTTRKSKMEG